jgi:ABC-2 type transport system permease protein
MKRYIRIYLKLMELNFATLVAYRDNLINNILSSVAWGTFSFISILLLTSQTKSIFGWKSEEIILLTAVFSIIVGIFHSIFARNFEQLPNNILYGKLDSTLVKPVDSQFFSSSYTIAYTPLIRVVIGIIAAGIILRSLHISVGVSEMIPFTLVIGFSILLLYSIWSIVVTTLFWNPRLSNVVDVMYTITGMVRYPGEMYKNIRSELFIAVLPLTFVAVTPVKVLIHSCGIYDVAGLIGFAVTLLFLSRIYWKFALRFYSSASG